MADEEVDWGVDEVAVDNAVGVADEDVLSLGGDEASPPPAEKEPEPKTNSIADNDKVDETGKLLPAGWTKITSRTHGKVFYHNTSTKQTSWDIPTESIQVAPEAEKTESLEKKKKEETPAATPSIAASSPRIAPSGPASWRSAQGQGQNQGGPQGQRNRERDQNDGDRDNKRTRLSSPPSSGNTNAGNGNNNGNGNGNNRFPSRAEPPRRPRSPPPGPSLSRGPSFRSDPPPGPRSTGPGLPVRQPTGPGLNHNGFDRRRDMDPPARPARDRSPPRGPSNRPENQAPFRPSDGSNHAPVLNNRWGTPGAPTSSRAGSEPRPQPGLLDRMAPAPVDERAKLLEKKRKAQEELDKIKEEEDRLERIERDKKEDAQRIKRREEERRKEDELAEARRRGLPAAPPHGAGFGPRDDFDRGPLRRDDRDRDWRDDRRPDFDRRDRDFDDRRRDDRDFRGRDPRDRPSMGPGGRAFEPSSYRPSDSPPPLSARLRSPPPRRALSPPRRALSPMGRPRSPPRRALSPMGMGRARSPPRGQGDSYRPERDGPALPPHRGKRDSRPVFAEPMSGYAQKMAPPRERPLAERMSLDDRDRRYPPRDDRDRDRDRRW